MLTVEVLARRSDRIIKVREFKPQAKLNEKIEAFVKECRDRGFDAYIRQTFQLKLDSIMVVEAL